MTANTILQNGKTYELTGELRAALPGEFFLSGSIVTLCEEGQRYAYAIVREVTPPTPFPVEYECASYEGDSLIIKDDGPLGLYLQVLSDTYNVQLSPADMADLHERLGRHLEAQA